MGDPAGVNPMSASALAMALLKKHVTFWRESLEKEEECCVPQEEQRNDMPGKTISESSGKVSTPPPWGKTENLDVWMTFQNLLKGVYPRNTESVYLKNAFWSVQEKTIWTFEITL